MKNWLFFFEYLRFFCVRLKIVLSKSNYSNIRNPKIKNKKWLLLVLADFELFFCGNNKAVERMKTSTYFLKAASLR